MNELLKTLFEDGKVFATKEETKKIRGRLYRKELIANYHYIIVFLGGDKFLIELDPEAMEEYYEGRLSND